VFAEAQKLLEQAVEVAPNDPEANYSVGMFYARQDQLQRASDYLEKAWPCARLCRCTE